MAVTVGEKHSLAVQRWSAAQLEGMAHVPWLAAAAPVPHGAAAAAALVAEEDHWYQHAADGLMDASQLTTPRGLAALEAEASVAESVASPSPSPSPGKPSPVRPGPRRARPAAGTVGVPSLQRICEEEVARRLVDPRTCLQVGGAGLSCVAMAVLMSSSPALGARHAQCHACCHAHCFTATTCPPAAPLAYVGQILEYADLAGAEVLRAYCLAVAVCNLVSQCGWSADQPLVRQLVVARA